MIAIDLQSYSEIKPSLDESVVDKDALFLWWLGQAGFALKAVNCFVLIDPYLSDYLAKKYRHHRFPHTRMMAPPILANEIRGLDWVICTHRHSDHMDPETLAPLAHENELCRFLVPKAEVAWAIKLGLPQERVIGVNDGDDNILGDRIRLRAVASAHEEFKINKRGEHHFLGYVLDMGMIRLYHSGDGIPYPGLVKKLEKYQIDVGLLPINGRGALRKSENIPGNFTLKEAIGLCDEAGIDVLLGHHFGMFDFNTIDKQSGIDELIRMPHQCHALLVEEGKKYILTKECKKL
jgi:L-ascorbate metabolism protein UlaG (beta-lactamase superfamily)